MTDRVSVPVPETTMNLVSSVASSLPVPAVPSARLPKSAKPFRASVAVTVQLPSPLASLFTAPATRAKISSL